MTFAASSGKCRLAKHAPTCLRQYPSKGAHGVIPPCESECVQAQHHVLCVEGQCGPPAVYAFNCDQHGSATHPHRKLAIEVYNARKDGIQKFCSVPDCDGTPHSGSKIELLGDFTIFPSPLPLHDILDTPVGPVDWVKLSGLLLREQHVFTVSTTTRIHKPVVDLHRTTPPFANPEKLNCVPKDFFYEPSRNPADGKCLVYAVFGTKSYEESLPMLRCIAEHMVEVCDYAC